MSGPFDQLSAALAAGPIPRTIGLDRTPRGERSAAVLMLFTEADDPEVTFVTRAETLRRHAGQVALHDDALGEEAGVQVVLISGEFAAADEVGGAADAGPVFVEAGHREQVGDVAGAAP